MAKTGSAGTLSTIYRDLMRQQERGAKLLDQFAALGETVAPVPIPDDAALTVILQRFDVPEEEIPGVLAARATIVDDPELRWLIDRHVAIMRDNMGKVTREFHFLDIPLEFGTVAQYFYFYVYAAMMPYTQAYFDSRGIPPGIVEATISDFGSKVRVHRRNTGVPGLSAPWWLQLQFRGMIYQLGRLQFERVLLDERIGEAVQHAGLPWGPGSRALSLHIRDFMGPFTPEACDASFAQARDFFPAHFPEEEPVGIGLCHSWLLDDQLPDHLKPTSNIVRFQQRFHLVYQGERDDASVANFVFGTSTMPETPREGASSLERALIAHNRAGGHWGWGTGWLELQAQHPDHPRASTTAQSTTP